MTVESVFQIKEKQSIPRFGCSVPPEASKAA
jgi:hypothetical protein